MVRFTEDVRGLNDLKTQAAKVIDKVVRTRRPTLITRRGKAVAVLVEVSEFERMQDDQSFRAAVKEGVLAEKSGRLHDDAAAEAIFEKFGASTKSRRRKK